jgi:diguanylate cyclase (GGDEF)-like protein
VSLGAAGIEVPSEVEAKGGRRPQRLLERWRPYRVRRLSARELRVESVMAAAFVAVAAALPPLLGTDRPLDAWLALGLVVSFAVAARVRLYVGAGYAVPTQLVLVPMLFLLPVSSVPLWVGCGMALSALYDAILRREHPERILSGIANGWHALGPSVVLALAGEPAAELGALPLLVAALGAQWATDLGSSTAREWLGRGIAPEAQLRVIASVYLIDAALTPVGLAAAVVATGHRFGFLVVAPLLALFAALAYDRNARIEEAVARLDQLRVQRARLDRAIHRIGEAFASNLDRQALVELMLRTAVESVEAQHGRVTLATRTIEWAAQAGPGTPSAALDEAEHRARRNGRLSAVHDGETAAIAYPLIGHDAAATDNGVLAIARRGGEFMREERALFGYLAQQTAIAMENVALHDRLRWQATVDELTGLANRRRFQDSLAAEVARMVRFRRPLALAILEIDGFKAVNDAYGFPQGDLVLREVASVVRRSSRPTDEPARYRGEQLAIILPNTDPEGAYSMAEAIRRAVQAVEVRLPEGARVRVTVSVGVSALDPSLADPSALVAAAEAALGEARRAGKNRTAGGGWVRVARG